MTDKFIKAIVDMDEEQAMDISHELLSQGVDPMTILDGCRKAMDIVGERFEKGEYFVPELILAGEMLKGITAEVKPYLQTDLVETSKRGKVLVGTVKGDIHDIGKDIVVFMLDVNGFEVKDLGVDVPIETFISEIKSFQPNVIALSGFLTLAFTAMKDTIDAINAEGLRDDVKIMVGGGTVDDKVRVYSGADAYGVDAMTAVAFAKQWIGEN